MKLFLTIALLFNVSAWSAVKNGENAPNFRLFAAEGKEVSLSDFKGKTVVLEWTNKDCPFVRKHYDSKNMQNLQAKYTGKDVVWLSIISSAKDKQGYLTADEAVKVKSEEGSKATYVLLDPHGEVGKLYSAKTTPHMYVINPKGLLAYQGAIDSIKSADKSDVSRAENYVAYALDRTIAGKAVEKNANTKPYGCSVKYK